MAQIKLTAADAADMPTYGHFTSRRFPVREAHALLDAAPEGARRAGGLLCAAGERGGFLGLAPPLLDGDRVLMAYFAVVPEARGQGAGSPGAGCAAGALPGKMCIF